MAIHRFQENTTKLLKQMDLMKEINANIYKIGGISSIRSSKKFLPTSKDFFYGCVLQCLNQEIPRKNRLWILKENYGRMRMVPI